MGSFEFLVFFVVFFVVGFCFGGWSILGGVFGGFVGFGVVEDVWGCVLLE